GSYVSCPCLLDRNIYGSVLRRRYEQSSSVISCSNGVFPCSKLFKTFRTYVYVPIRSLLYTILYWIHVVLRIYLSSRLWTLIWTRLLKEKYIAKIAPAPKRVLFYLPGI